MELTDGQKKGLEIACQRYKDNKPYTVIAGYAGTGKTTLVHFIIQELGLHENQVVFVAYTGKAALVLKQKGNKNAMTAHKLLYHSEELPDGTYRHTPRVKLEKKYSLVVVDEASMLPQEMIDLLLSHHVHTIFLGDPMQLPPIDSEQTILDHPHVFLDEIVRQALENPIIKLSMDIRNGKRLAYSTDDKRCRIIHREKASDKLLLGADQILCGKNKTRHELNEYMRRLILGNNYGNEPVNGDKVICLKNHWNTVNSIGNELVNGTIGELYNISIKEVPPYGQVIYANFISDDGGIYRNLMIDYNLIVNGQPTINSENWKKFSGYPKPFEFAFSYVVTVHKSQGSEFNRVVVFEEWLGDYESHKRWLYTAATRASEQLVIVR